MAKVQTRRTISVKGLTYKRLKDFCDVRGLTVSGFVELLITDKLDAAGVPVPTGPLTPPEPRVTKDDEATGQHFTF